MYNIKIRTKEQVLSAIYRGDISSFYKSLTTSFKTGMVLIEGEYDSTILPVTSIDSITVVSCTYSDGKPSLRLV